MEIVSSAIKLVGYAIKQDEPYTGELRLSAVLWERFMQETADWFKTNKRNVPESLNNKTTANWYNQNKTVVLLLVKAEVTSPELEEALLKTIQKLSIKLSKDAEKLSRVPSNTRSVSAERNLDASAVDSN